MYCQWLLRHCRMRAAHTNRNSYSTVSHRPHGADELQLGLLEHAVTDSAFGHKHAARGVAFATACEWALLSHLPVQAFLLHQCAANIVRLAVPKLELHAMTLGCIQDYCGVKQDFNIKLRTADFCPGCREVVEHAISKAECDALTDMLEAARQQALGRPILGLGFQPLALSELVDREYPFPIAWAHRAVQLEPRPEQRWFKLVQLFDVTFRYIAAVGVALTSDLPSHSWPSSIRSLIRGISRASLGTRQALACEYLRWLPTLGSDARLPTMVQAMIRDRRRLDVLSRALQIVVQDRNRTIGHGATLGGEA